MKFTLDWLIGKTDIIETYKYINEDGCYEGEECSTYFEREQDCIIQIEG